MTATTLLAAYRALPHPFLANEVLHTWQASFLHYACAPKLACDDLVSFVALVLYRDRTHYAEPADFIAGYVFRPATAHDECESFGVAADDFAGRDRYWSHLVEPEWLREREPLVRGFMAELPDSPLRPFPTEFLAYESATRYHYLHVHRES